LPTPTKTGYTFLGWYTSEDYETKVEDNTIVKTANDHTLYANWIAIKYTIKLTNSVRDITLTGSNTEEYTIEEGIKIQELFSSMEIKDASTGNPLNDLQKSYLKQSEKELKVSEL
jgi:uncharacterized repeat protein (TIGR02543 family)